jgi:SAM-dependent methyltransferase
MTMTSRSQTLDAIYVQEGIIEVPFPDWKITGGSTPEDKTILNVGGGTSKDIWHLTKNNRCYVLDASPIALATAVRHGVHGVLGDLEQGLIPFPNESFDIVICKDVLEHLVHPECILAEIRRVLKNDGYIVINIPNHFYFMMRLKILLGKGVIWSSLFHHHERIFKAWNYMHIRFFTYKQFMELLRETSLTCIRAFWDLGTLNHYLEPSLIVPHFRRHLRSKAHLDRRERLILYLILPGLQTLDVCFPRWIRTRIAALRPSFFSSCFYVWCSKKV